MLDQAIFSRMRKFNHAIAGSAAGLRLTDELRTVYFQSILSQDTTFSDLVGAGEVATRSNKDMDIIRAVSGERFGFVVMNSAVIVGVRRTIRVDPCQSDLALLLA